MTFPYSCYLLGLNGVLPTITKKKNVTDYLFVLLSKYLRFLDNKAVISLSVKISAYSFPTALFLLQMVLFFWML